MKNLGVELGWTGFWKDGEGLRCIADVGVYDEGAPTIVQFQSLTSWFNNWQSIPLTPLRSAKGGDSSLRSE